MRLPRLTRRRRKAAGHPGVRFRISTVNGVIVDVDSEQLYFAAKYRWTDSCIPGCPPGCDRHGWLDLIAGGDTPALEYSQVPLKIEIRPVMLGDHA